MKFTPTLSASLIASILTASALSSQPGHAALGNYSMLAQPADSVLGAANPAASKNRSWAQSPLLRAKNEGAGFLRKGLNKSRKGLVVDNAISYNDEMASPSFIWADSAQASAPVGVLKEQEKARSAAVFYVREHAAAYGLDQALTGLYTRSIHDTGRGAVIVKMVQKQEGVEVYGAELNITMRRDYSLVALSGALSSRIKKSSTALKSRAESMVFTLLPTQALDSVFAELNIVTPVNALVLREKRGTYQHYKLPSTKARQGLSDLRSKPVFFPMPSGLVPAYYVEVGVSGAQRRDDERYGYIVSAQDGKILQRKNQQQKDGFAYRVYAETEGTQLPLDGPQGRAGHPHPANYDNGYIAPLGAPSLVINKSGPISTRDPWLSPEALVSQGNNVDAYVDRSGDDGFDGEDFRAQVNGFTSGGEKSFDYVLDTSQFPAQSETQTSAAIVNMFYVNNWLHDWFYDSGFDEAAGNAQVNNFGRGGVGADALHSQAQDYEGTDNANMSTPADGASPRMQMYLFHTSSDGPRISFNAPSGQPYINAGWASFGAQEYALGGELALYYDGEGKSDEALSDGCEPALNSAELNGKIAFIYRDDAFRSICDLGSKAVNARAAGAIGVIIANGQSYNGREAPELYGDAPELDIPVVSTTTEDGDLLRTLMASPGLNIQLTSPAATRDSSFDNLIIAHEWGHYLSNRLVGDAGGLLNNQGGAMGEGWSDFIALLLTVEARDLNTAANADWAGAYAMGGYALQGTKADASYFKGVRDYPYSTDLRLNPLTFAYVGLDPRVHSSGTVWASALWEAYAALLKQSARLSFEQAQLRMKDYLVAAFKITPLNPTFTEARDALLAVAMASDPLDADVFARAFAKRGMGAGAVSPDRFSTDHVGVQESFSEGGAATVSAIRYELSKDCDADGIFDAGDEALMHFNVNNIGFVPLNNIGALVDNTYVSSMGAATADKSTLQVGESTHASLPVRLNWDLSQGLKAQINIRATSPNIDPAVQLLPNGVFGVFNYDLQTGSTAFDNGNKALLSDWHVSVDSATSDPSTTVASAASSVRLDEDDTENYVYVVWNQAVTADTAFATPEITVGADDALTLNWQMAWYFEFDYQQPYDGGVVEYRVDGGEWLDAGANLTPAYNDFLSYSANPVFKGEGRAGYFKVNAASEANRQLTLEPATLSLKGLGLAGKKVQVRFRTGSDPYAAGLGFVIDDIQISGGGTPFSTLKPSLESCVAVAISGPQEAIEGNKMVFNASLNGGFSTPVSYVWQRISGPEVTISPDPTGASASIVAPQVSANSPLLIRVTASDGSGHSASADTSVNITNIPKQNSSGGGGFYLPLLACIALLRRYQLKRKKSQFE